MQDSEIRKLCDDIEEYCSKATPGPWLFAGNDCDDNDDDPYVYVELPETNGGVSLLFEADWGKTEDAEFIARARADLPTLVAALREKIEAERWILVSERLPEISEDGPEFVQAVFKDEWRGRSLSAIVPEDDAVASPCGIDTIFIPYLRQHPIIFTHWRPLPSAPEVQA